MKEWAVRVMASVCRKESFLASAEIILFDGARENFDVCLVEQRNDIPPVGFGSEPPPNRGGQMKRAAGPLAALGVLLAKFKALLIPLVKFFPILLKTGGSMILTVGVYALQWGWRFALGFVLLIFIHECGHLVAARRLGLKVGAPVFIPFMGAFIALKESPPNAWVEAQVGIGGPLMGALGAACCWPIYLWTHNPMFAGLAYFGFYINLFNLAPIGFLDGGRIVTALSPLLWIVGTCIIGLLMVLHFNFILLFIFITSLPRLFSLFRKKSAEELRYFEVASRQRWLMGGLYFGLAAFLTLGMMFTESELHRSLGE
jgi:Zn-dependent protease